MSISVMMPELGESVTEGTITRWLKSVGDMVEEDEPLVEVSTDKVDTEIPSPVSGVVLEIAAVEDDVVPVGALLARVGERAELGGEPKATPTAVSPDHVTRQPPLASPLTRKVARDAGIDLDAVCGTRPHGRIARADLASAEPVPSEQSAPRRPPPTSTRSDRSADSRQEPLPKLRQAVRPRTAQSLRASAQATAVAEIDVTTIARVRDSAQLAFAARHGIPLTFLPFFAKAVIEALDAHPTLNASIAEDGTTVTSNETVHLGISIDKNRRLLVPVLHDAGSLTLPEVALGIAELAERTRSDGVSPDDLSGGTFTLDDAGSRGVLVDTPIISRPQVGILSIGAIVKRPVVVPGAQGDDAIAVRSIALVALTYDQRLVDPADAAGFLGTLRKHLTDDDFETELAT